MVKTNHEEMVVFLISRTMDELSESGVCPTANAYHMALRMAAGRLDPENFDDTEPSN